jgi:hypothetical protein
MYIVENGCKPQDEILKNTGFWWIRKKHHYHDNKYYLNKRSVVYGIHDFKILEPDYIQYRENDIVIENLEGLEIFESGDNNNTFYKLFLNGKELF